MGYHALYGAGLKRSRHQRWRHAATPLCCGAIAAGGCDAFAAEHHGIGTPRKDAVTGMATLNTQNMHGLRRVR